MDIHPIIPRDSLSGTVELIVAGNVIGDDGNWRIDISTGDFIITKRISGSWSEDGIKFDSPDT